MRKRLHSLGRCVCDESNRTDLITSHLLSARIAHTSQLKLIAGEVTETVLQLYNFERYVQAGVSSRAVIIYAVVYSFSLGALPWMLLHENVWIHRDAPLIMDLCLDLFYSAIFPMNIVLLSALARGTYMEEEGEFWVGTVSDRFSLSLSLPLPLPLSLLSASLSLILVGL